MKFATFQLKSVYDTVSDVVEKKVQWGSDFQSGSRLIHIYGIECDLLKTRKLSNSLILLFILDSRAQKSPKVTQKLSLRITFYSIFLIGMAYIWWDLVIPFVQRVQNMYGKGGGGSLRPI